MSSKVAGSRPPGPAGLRPIPGLPAAIVLASVATGLPAAVAGRPRDTKVSYLTSESILNIGRYMAMMITPTIRPTPIIISGSMMLVSVWIEASTSSS